MYKTLYGSSVAGEKSYALCEFSVVSVTEKQLTGFLYIGSSERQFTGVLHPQSANSLREFCSMGAVLRTIRVFSSLSKREAAYRISVHWK